MPPTLPSLLPYTFPLLRLIYPIPEKCLKRDRPLEVLALGLSRSGTDSLKRALSEHLGYQDCHHGWRFIHDPSETLVWARLFLKKHRGEVFGAEDFDRVLGDCAAVTDVPGNRFARELCDAYPNAKIILNHRDIGSWHKSSTNTLEKHNDLSWPDWIVTFFHPVLFWNHHVMLYLSWQEQFDYDFQKNGRRVYREHYRRLEEKLEGERRPYLKWTVEDGWTPLCKFLGKTVPDEAFPSGNMPADYGARIAEQYAEWQRQARWKMSLVLGGLVAVIAILVALAARAP